MGGNSLLKGDLLHVAILWFELITYNKDRQYLLLHYLQLSCIFRYSKKYVTSVFGI